MKQSYIALVTDPSFYRLLPELTGHLLAALNLLVVGASLFPSLRYF